METIFVDDESSLASPSFMELICFLSADIRNWIRNIEQHASDNVNKILVGNKADMDESKRVNSFPCHLFSCLYFPAQLRCFWQEYFFRLSPPQKVKLLQMNMASSSLRLWVIHLGLENYHIHLVGHSILKLLCFTECQDELKCGRSFLLNS